MTSKDEHHKSTRENEENSQQKRTYRDIITSQRAKKLERKDETVTEEELAETDYYFDGGLRCVRPYWFKFSTFTKPRWAGKQLIDVLATEFIDYPSAYYEEKIDKGLVSINGSVATKRQIPPSMPVHSCGRYRHNTILMIMANDFGLKSLHCVHRLDRLTSGLLILAKTKGSANKLASLIRGGLVQKTYVARVAGNFPAGRQDVSVPILTQPRRKGLSETIDIEDGKISRTVFDAMGYDEVGLAVGGRIRSEPT
ncbi:RNA pseudouridylate synthase domain-containing protein 2-like [Planoprotostelium fungivorum]|uniref:RNA pseudouridylate synthase domain-containing protein 2-like n=1 Tax=Planoprotostelium fungivorum TaxID=1890364 RepID=A0A2P6NDA8_9EUKA|nr:RNA pseudouridylate synthase domain-containing protein 2-like [Planoprotostelium fungivorum]